MLVPLNVKNVGATGRTLTGAEALGVTLGALTVSAELIGSLFDAGKGRSDFISLLGRAQNRLGDFADTARMLDGVRTLCTPPELADQVTAFVENHPLPAGGRTVEQILERLAVSVAFGQREGRSLAASLAETVGAPQ